MNGIERRLQRIEGAVAQRSRGRVEASRIDLKGYIAPCYYELDEDVQNGRYQYFNLPGGRGSAKSSFVSLEIVKGVMKDITGRTNAIVFRLVAGTMRESVYSQIAWAIDTLGVNALWRGKVSPMQYEYIPTGAQIIFRGLDDASKLKSIKPQKGTFRFVWFEEFSEIPGELLLRSVEQSVIRGGNDFIVFRSFNPPISLNNWANMYIKQPDKRAKTLLTDYRNIPAEWLGEAFIYEAERLKAVNPKAYQHEYLGIPTGTGGEVFPNLEIREITDEELQYLQYIYQGVDFGFAVDPLCFLRMAYERKKEKIYFLDEIYERHWSNERLAREIKDRKYDNYTIVCDCAEPKSIIDLRSKGLPARECFKRPGAVLYRVKWMQHRTIVIDPKRTPNAYREFTQYSYPVDKNGNLLSELVDKDNHSIDAAAYGLNNLIFSREATA